MAKDGYVWGGEGRTVFQGTYGVSEEVVKRRPASPSSESRVAAPCSLASTIAHELSHIMLDSHDEAKVEKRTRLVMQQEHAVLLAQRQQTKPSLPPQ